MLFGQECAGKGLDKDVLVLDEGKVGVAVVEPGHHVARKDWFEEVAVLEIVEHHRYPLSSH